MRRYAVSLLCLLLVGATISAAPASRVSEPGLRVEGETLVIVTKLPFKIIAPPGGKLYFWDLPLGWKHDASKVSVKNVVTVSEAPEGSSVVSAVSVDKDFTPSEYRLTVNVGKVTPPAPPPEPNPPGPSPSPGPSPIPLAGFRVLMIYESADLSKMPAAQQAVLFSKSIRDYLNSKCIVGPDGKTKEWRIYDKDVDLSAESKTWQNAMKRPRAGVPWLIISTGTAGFEGPLPATVEDTVALLRKFGGA